MNIPGRRMLFVLIIVMLSQMIATVSAQNEPVTLNVWIFEGEDVFMPTLIEAFQAEHPNINVQITSIPEDEYATKIDTAILAAQPPDLGYIYERRMIAGGYFLPLDEAIAAQGINIDDYNIGALSQSCLVNGQVYCIGTYTGAVLLFYNKDLFDAAGLAYPSPTEPMTMDEFADAALKLTVFSDNFEERVWGSDVGRTQYWTDLRNFFSEDGRTAVGYVNDEATIHAHQVLAGMFEAGSIISSSDAAMVEGIDLMPAGKVAMSITDNAVAMPLLETAGVRWGAAVPPVEVAGQPSRVALWSDGLGVFTGSNQQEAATLFALFLATRGNELRIETTGDLPLNMRLAEESNWAGESEGRQEILAAVQTARPDIFVPDFWGVSDPVNEAFSLLMLEDGLSAQEAFDEVAPIIQENLDEAWVTWDQIQPAQ